MSEKDLAREIKRLEKLMLEHARNLEFEKGRAGARSAGPSEGPRAGRAGLRRLTHSWGYFRLKTNRPSSPQCRSIQ
jgi:hypothetical protein